MCSDACGCVQTIWEIFGNVQNVWSEKCFRNVFKDFTRFFHLYLYLSGKFLIDVTFCLKTDSAAATAGAAAGAAAAT